MANPVSRRKAGFTHCIEAFGDTLNATLRISSRRISPGRSRQRHLSGVCPTFDPVEAPAEELRAFSLPGCLTIETFAPAIDAPDPSCGEATIAVGCAVQGALGFRCAEGGASFGGSFWHHLRHAR